jgi:hypothetical protein
MFGIGTTELIIVGAICLAEGQRISASTRRVCPQRRSVRFIVIG